MHVHNKEAGMAFMQWDPKYELGIVEMDRRHKKWITLLDGFYVHLNSRDMASNMKELVDAAADYTRYHFSEVEKLMAAMKYPLVDRQKQMHNQIVDTMLSYRQDLLRKKLVVSVPITRVLKSRLNEHIAMEDKKDASHYFSGQHRG